MWNPSRTRAVYTQHGAALPLTKYPGDTHPSRIFLCSMAWGAPSPTLRCTNPGPKTRRSHVVLKHNLDRATHPALSCGTSASGPRSPQPGSTWLGSLEPLLAPLPPGKQNQEASASIPPSPGCTSSFLRYRQSHSGLNPSAGRGCGHHREDGLMQQPPEIHLKSYMVANSQPRFSQCLNAQCEEASRMRRYFL